MLIFRILKIKNKYVSIFDIFEVKYKFYRWLVGWFWLNFFIFRIGLFLEGVGVLGKYVCRVFVNINKMSNLKFVY